MYSDVCRGGGLSFCAVFIFLPSITVRNDLLLHGMLLTVADSITVVTYIHCNFLTHNMAQKGIILRSPG